MNSLIVCAMERALLILKIRLYLDEFGRPLIDDQYAS